MFFRCCKSSVKINPDIARGVLQGEAGVTTSLSKQYIVGSHSAGLCVIITMYNPNNKIAGVAHVDARAQPLQAIVLLEYQINKDEKDEKCQLEIELASANQFMGKKTLEDLKLAISERKNMILKSIHTSSSLAIDAKTGKTFKNVDAKEFDNGLHPTERLNDRGNSAMFSFGNPVGIKFVFDGRAQLVQVASPKANNACIKNI